jgi:PII-like signaling protein
MQTQLKKKVEIIIEASMVERLCKALKEGGATGYTVTPAVKGSGTNGTWSRRGMISESQRMYVVLTVLDESDLEGALEKVYALLSRQIGIVIVTDVQVIRGERF